MRHSHFSGAIWATDSIIMPPRKDFYQSGIFNKEIADVVLKA